MIYEYEAKVLDHIHNAIPEIELATYAREQDMFSAMSQVTKYPSFFYYRENSPWDFPPTWQILEGTRPVSFAPIQQKYIGRILVANVADTFKVASALRFYWVNNAYLKVPYKFDENEDVVEVGLRLLYIKADEDRSGADKKGPLRFVEFSWSSQLFLDDFDMDPVMRNLVEEVHLYHTDNGVGLFNKNNLIKIIK